MGSLVIFQRRLPRDQWGTQRVKRDRVGPRSDAGVARVDRQTVAGHVILTSFSGPSGRPKILDTNANTSPYRPGGTLQGQGSCFGGEPVGLAGVKPGRGGP